MKKMAEIVQKATPSSLILLDELGSGTIPMKVQHSPLLSFTNPTTERLPNLSNHPL
jgi:Mismatch repair ATPase (MutS family)